MHGERLPQPDERRWARHLKGERIDAYSAGVAPHGEEDALDLYRRVRDEIRAFIETLPKALTRQDPAT